MTRIHRTSLPSPSVLGRIWGEARKPEHPYHGRVCAGQTESTKKVIQYLAAIAADSHSHSTTPAHSHSPSLSSSSPFGAVMPLRTPILRHKLLERKFLANPILEAFGNAQTQRKRNNKSKTEPQSQIVALRPQVRELRSVFNDAEADALYCRRRGVGSKRSLRPSRWTLSMPPGSTQMANCGVDN